MLLKERVKITAKHEMCEFLPLAFVLPILLRYLRPTQLYSSLVSFRGKWQLNTYVMSL